jgi:DNA-binding response OmpR family regulator
VQGKKVLLIDDDLDTQKIISDAFTPSGAQVFSATSGKAGLLLLHKRHPDLVILDIILSAEDGQALCRLIRQHSNVPIIVLTAFHNQEIELKSFSFGATDFITKPFSTRILLARAKAALRKVQQAKIVPTSAIYEDDFLTIYLAHRTVRSGGKDIEISPNETRLLASLISHLGRVVTHQQLANFIWSAPEKRSIASVHRLISSLRRKLELGNAPKYLYTVRGLGYRFQPPTPRKSCVSS